MARWVVVTLVGASTNLGLVPLYIMMLLPSTCAKRSRHCRARYSLASHNSLSKKRSGQRRFAHGYWQDSWLVGWIRAVPNYVSVTMHDYCQGSGCVRKVIKNNGHGQKRWMDGPAHPCHQRCPLPFDYKQLILFPFLPHSLVRSKGKRKNHESSRT